MFQPLTMPKLQHRKQLPLGGQAAVGEIATSLAPNASRLPTGVVAI